MSRGSISTKIFVAKDKTEHLVCKMMNSIAEIEMKEVKLLCIMYHKSGVRR